MKIDLSKPHKLVGPLCIWETGEVFRMNGEFVGKLPEGDFPTSPEDILKAVKTDVPTPKKEAPARSGISVATLYRQPEKKKGKKKATKKGG